MRNLTRVLLCFVVLALTGCAHRTVHYSPLVDAPRPPRSPASVQVFVTQKPEAPYVELGTLSYLTYRYNPDDAMVIGLLRDKAAAIGADAIIILETRPELATNYITKQSYQGKVFRAMAIAYRGSP